MESKPRKLKLVVSDFHIGDGKRLPDGTPNIGEDFFFDEDFIAFLSFYMDMYPDGGDVELVINGDFLNFNLVFYRGTHPVHVTSEISLEKLKNIMNAHPSLFEKLSQFGKKPGFQISYVIGNHDADMVWPECKAYFKERLGVDVKYHALCYDFDGVHVEHGNRFELINYFNVHEPIIHEDKVDILNLPFGTFFCTHYLAPIKVTKPHIDKIRPFRVFLFLDLLMHFPSAFLVLVKFFVFFFGMLISPYKKRFPSIGNTLQIILAGIAVYFNLDRSARALLRKHKHIHTVVFGHTHISRIVEMRDKKKYLNCGTWNEITTLDLNQFGKKERKTFVEIVYPENSQEPPKSRLRVWEGNWHPVRTIH